MDKLPNETLHDIDSIEEGTIVEGELGFSIVKRCIHGKKYYANMNDYNPSEDEGRMIPWVVDDDEDMIPCCG